MSDKKFDDNLLHAIANPKQAATFAGMDRLLTTLAEEFPGYHSDQVQAANAGLALATMLGSVGAWVMFRSNSPEASLDKFMKMVNAAALDMANKSYPLIDARIKAHGFQQEPWNDPRKKQESN